MRRAVGGSVSCWPLTARARLHAGWEAVLQRWYDWLPEVKKKDDAKKMEGEHQKKSVK